MQWCFDGHKCTRDSKEMRDISYRGKLNKIPQVRYLKQKILLKVSVRSATSPVFMRQENAETHVTTTLQCYLHHKDPQALWDMDKIDTDHEERTSYSRIWLKDEKVYKLMLQGLPYFSTCCQQAHIVHFRKHKLSCQIFSWQLRDITRIGIPFTKISALRISFAHWNCHHSKNNHT